jgi:hypothetical protein
VFHDLITWRPWLVFISAVYGLPLSPEGQRIFCQHTGRRVYTPRPGGYPETVACIGGRAGRRASPGRFLDMKPFVRLKATAQVGARVVTLDVLAFYRTSENFPADQEMLRAVRPCVATTCGKIIILSSPYGQSGALFELHRKYYGRDDSDTLVWQASAPEMNSTLPTDYVTRMQQDDPEAYASEVLGQFRTGVSAFLDPAAIAACVAEGVREVPPAHGVTYSAFADVSGGRHDRFVIAVGHCRGELAVLDAFRAWTPPFNPAGVIEEACEFLRRYKIRSISGDRYAAEFVAEQFRKHGIEYLASQWDRSGIYMELQPLLNAGRVSLLDQPELLRELRGLERRRGQCWKRSHRPSQRRQRRYCERGFRRHSHRWERLRCHLGAGELFLAARLILLKDARHHDDIHTTNRGDNLPHDLEGFNCTKSLSGNLAERPRAVIKTPKRTAITAER